MKKKQKTVIIVHGWDGNPNIGWFKWLRSELKKRGFKVIAPIMPHPEAPKISAWVGTLKKLINDMDENTILVGHSMGTQTILRYLEKSRSSCGKCILVAPFMKLTEYSFTEDPENEKSMRKIAKPWLTKEIALKEVRKHSREFIMIFSEDDPYIDLSNAKIFRKELGSKIIIQKNKRHFEEDRTEKIPVLLKEIN